jgi:hypothetical protein
MIDNLWRLAGTKGRAQVLNLASVSQSQVNDTQVGRQSIGDKFRSPQMQSRHFMASQPDRGSKHPLLFFCLQVETVRGAVNWSPAWGSQRSRDPVALRLTNVGQHVHCPSMPREAARAPIQHQMHRSRVPEFHSGSVHVSEKDMISITVSRHDGGCRCNVRAFTEAGLVGIIN